MFHLGCLKERILKKLLVFLFLSSIRTCTSKLSPGAEQC